MKILFPILSRRFPATADRHHGAWHRMMRRMSLPFFLLFFCPHLFAQSRVSPDTEHLRETFPQLMDGFVPQTVQALWKNYDPRKEPLDVEVLDEWKEAGDVICKVIRYRIGIFKGKKAMMAAVFAYPAKGRKVPALVQVCGGGQSANLNVVITNARRGYACISVNWLGNKMQGLRMGKEWQWDGANTDWGGADASQNTHNDHFYTLMPDSKTIDPVYSPRNSNWVLGMLGVRRAISFLEKQPMVDPALIGIYGHSMGGWLTFNVAAIDKRIKAAAPSAGAQLGREEEQESDIRWRTAASKGYAPYLTCPVMFVNPSNDFHGRIEDIEETIDATPAREIMFTRDPHLNHRTQPNHVVCGLLWMDQYLRKNFTFPANPQVAFLPDTSTHLPRVIIKPGVNSRIRGVDVYYSCGGEATGRYWEWVKAEEKEGIWNAVCPVLSTDETFRVFANINYSLDKPVTGASFYYDIYTTDKFTISSRMLTLKPTLLKMLGIKATDSTSLMIESFDSNWQKRWYEFNADGKWPYRTHKLNDKKWQAPSKNALLSLELKSAGNQAIQVELDEYVATIELKKTTGWQEVELQPSDFKLKEEAVNTQQPKVLAGWTAFKEMTIGPDRIAGAGQAGPDPDQLTRDDAPAFRNLRWKP